MGHPDDPISPPSRQRLRELDQLLVKAVADLHGPISLPPVRDSAHRSRFCLWESRSSLLMDSACVRWILGEISGAAGALPR